MTIVPTIILLLFGGLLLYYANDLILKHRSLVKTGRKTKAKVLEYKARSNSGDAMFYPLYEFTNEAGKITFVKGNIGTSWKRNRTDKNILYGKGKKGYEVVIDDPFYISTVPKLILAIGITVFMVGLYMGYTQIVP